MRELEGSQNLILAECSHLPGCVGLPTPAQAPLMETPAGRESAPKAGVCVGGSLQVRSSSSHRAGALVGWGPQDLLLCHEEAGAEAVSATVEIRWGGFVSWLCMTSNKPINLSQPQFPHLSNGDRNLQSQLAHVRPSPGNSERSLFLSTLPGWKGPKLMGHSRHGLPPH